ncbi:hypothetical protein RJ639_003670 [Escallonia herrerae]|uniref:PPM-type phosphatase domain-containing protein n=1 Tax=Escallonia herrerae TaxID=1293975 RepID=A0AA88W1X4_9ASTE|nr:hypothetical protein RJ639_003670 [Escallonia herrerae]
MLESCYRPLERCFGGGGGGDCLLWHMDLKPHASGDYSIAVVQANSSLEDQGQVFTSPSATYVGVYDGHEFASEQGGLSEEVIRKAFDATEEEFLLLVKRSWLAQPEIISVGSCCLVGAITKDLLYVANLGDSRAVLGRQVSDGRMTNASMVVAERLSTDHNVAVEEVRKEVKALHPDDSHIVVLTRGVWRIKGIIQVSRSIGDVYLKKPEFDRDPIFQRYASPIPLKRAVVSAEPSILIRKLRPQDLFLIFASDGLWEQLTDEAAVDIVLKNPRAVRPCHPHYLCICVFVVATAGIEVGGIAKRLVRAAVEEAARKREMRYDDIKRIGKGIRRHFHDDITVIVIYLDQQQGSPNGRLKDHRPVDCTSAPVDIFSFNSDEGDTSSIRILPEQSY